MDSSTLASLKLPAIADRVACDSIKIALQQALASGQNLNVDGADVQSIGTPCLQLLLSGRATFQNSGLMLGLVNPSERMTQVVSLLGLSGTLGQGEKS
jgi:anti-anti-sigma regulatory factor